MTQAFNLAQLANNLNTSGQLDATDGLTGALPIANGGTGQTTATNAINALLPNQSGNSGKFLSTDGSASSWATAPTGITTTAGSAPYYAARMWIIFNGSATTITNSVNVSSISRISTGNYQINFTTAMPDANYCALSGDYCWGVGWNDSLNTTYFRTTRWVPGSTVADCAVIFAAVFR